MCKTLFPKIILCAAAFILLTANFTAAEMRIFELQHKPAAELAEVVRHLVSEDAKVAAHRNTLVVTSTSSDLDEVARLVESYDHPLLMLRVSVEQGMSVDSKESGMTGAGRINTGSAQTRIGWPANPGDNSVMVSTGNGTVMFSGQASSQVEKHSSRHFMNVLDGSPAMISVGKAVPYTSSLRYYSRRHPHYVESFEYKQVDTGFEVLPEVYGNMVNLVIRPFMSFMDRQKPKLIVFHDMVTTVRIPLGSWFDLAGHVGKRDDLNGEIIGAAAGSQRVSNSIRIRVEPSN